MNLREEDYHAYPAWSYSLIARYAKEGFGAIATIHEPMKPTPSMEFGTLFDTIITRGPKALEEYSVVDVSVPDAERKALDYISTCTHEQFSNLSVDYIFDRCQECGYQPRWKAPTVYEHLAPFQKYYDAKQSGKKLVSQQDWQDAAEMALAFRNNEYTQSLFGNEDKNGIEYLYQTQFCEEVTLPSGKVVSLKIMPDLIVIDNNNKTVQLVDLKTSSVPSRDFKENFLKFRYDIQARLYSDVLSYIISKNPAFNDYEILDYLFTDISRTDKIPLTYRYPQNDESQINGFSFTIGDKTYQYKDWDVLLDEILDYEESQAVVPSYLTTEGPNDLLDILSSAK